jgi:hypothetical protein
MLIGMALAASAAHAGPLDAAAISATASPPAMAPTAGPTAAQPLTAGSLTSPLGGIASAPIPQVARPAQPAAVAPAK